MGLLAKLLKLILLFSLGCLIVLGCNIQSIKATETFNMTASSSNSVLLVKDRSLDRDELSGRDLLRQGQQQYQKGQFSTAIKTWQQAIDIFAVTEDKHYQSLAWGYIATARQRLGEIQSAQDAIANAFKLLESATKSKNSDLTSKIRARLLNIRGQLQLSQGQESLALQSWQDSENIYRQLKDTPGIIGSQVNQARALQTLGFQRRAQKILEQVRETMATQPASLLKAVAYNNLGKTYWYVGKLTASQKILEQSWDLSKQLAPTKSDPSLELSELQSNILLNLGNTARAMGNTEFAISYYRRSTAIAVLATDKIEAQIPRLNLLVETEQWQEAETLWQQIKASLAKFPIDRQTIYGRIDLAKNSIAMSKAKNGKADRLGYETEINQLLNEAIAYSQEIDDARSESTALGYLGYWYEQNQNWQQGQKYTRQALNLAQANQLPEITYRWHWQLGRLLQAQGNTASAIAHYTEAVETLQMLRRDLTAISPEIQFSFREQVEPVYRQLVELLLQHSPGAEISQQNLQLARQIIESLQIAELENYFRESCLTARPQAIESFDGQTAVIYPIILSQKIAIILSFPQQPLSYYETTISQLESEQILTQMRQSLRQTSFEQERLPIARTVYDLLVRPAETQLSNHKIDTLVFVLDDLLRTLPMSALYDGEQYLIEKYSIAIAPGLQLLEPRSLKRDRIKGLVGGLSKARLGFNALPGVIEEIEQVSSLISTQVLLNRNFTRSSIHHQVKDSDFPVVHLATHGQFSSSVEETFILAWDGKINARELALWLQLRSYDLDTPIELLVLSACETAAGDDRAALGMAGIAARSGVRSTIASLWSVQDDSTAILMTEFYQELSEVKFNKAEALRRAQLKLLDLPEYQHPYYWASFVLIGNWL